MLLNQSIIINTSDFFSSSDKLSIGDIPFIVEDSKQDVIKRLYIIGSR